MTELVPTIDLAPLSDAHAAPAAVAALASAVDDACRTVGFLQLVNHGIPAAVMDDVLAVSTEFFDLAEDDKLRWRPATLQSNRGYARLGSEALAYSLGVDSPPDLFEAFNIGVEHRDLSDPYYAAEAHRFFAPNIWPDRPARMRDTWLAYAAAAREVGHRMMRLFALALGLPEAFFVAACGRAPNVMRANNYERRPGTPDAEPGQMRMGAHTDYGCLTVLLADAVPGLQIVGPDGAWCDVVATPGALLVNLGDLLAEWTNDRWRSTLHRVVPPPAGTEGAFRRRSVAFFCEADYDHLVECLPTCTSADDPPKYPPVRAGDHLLAKLMGPRTLTPSDATQSLGDREAAVG